MITAYALIGGQKKLYYYLKTKAKMNSQGHGGIWVRLYI